MNLILNETEESKKMVKNSPTCTRYDVNAKMPDSISNNFDKTNEKWENGLIGFTLHNK